MSEPAISLTVSMADLVKMLAPRILSAHPMASLVDGWHVSVEAVAGSIRVDLTPKNPAHAALVRP